MTVFRKKPGNGKPAGARKDRGRGTEAAVFAAVACAVLLGMSGCGQSKMAAEESGGSRQVMVFEDFTAQDLDGNEVDESVFAGYDLTMINLWGTFCGPCLQEMPDLGEIADEYKDKGFQIVGICTDAVGNDGTSLPDVVSEATEIAEETGADYLHILPTGEIFTDLLPRVSGVPTTIFVDREGKQVGLADMGAKSKDGWLKVIDEKLAQVQQEAK